MKSLVYLFCYFPQQYCVQLKSIIDFKNFYYFTDNFDVLKVIRNNIRNFSKNADEFFIYVNALVRMVFTVLSEC